MLFLSIASIENAFSDLACLHAEFADKLMEKSLSDFKQKVASVPVILATLTTTPKHESVCLHFTSG